MAAYAPILLTEASDLRIALRPHRCDRRPVFVDELMVALTQPCDAPMQVRRELGRLRLQLWQLHGQDGAHGPTPRFIERPVAACLGGSITLVAHEALTLFKQLAAVLPLP